MRVCMEPRLLPGVRCSTLKMVKSCPSCWMTMPGRSCVALTLLIVFFRGPDRVGGGGSLESLLISEIPAGGPSTMPQPRSESLEAHRRIHVTSAKQQYRWRYSKRSIRLLRLFQTDQIIPLRILCLLPSRACRSSGRAPSASLLVPCDRSVFPCRGSRGESHPF